MKMNCGTGIMAVHSILIVVEVRVVVVVLRCIIETMLGDRRTKPTFGININVLEYLLEGNHKLA